MKTFYKIILGLFVLVLFSGCSMYQLVSLSGDLPFNDKFQFYSENSDVKVVYSFNGQGGPIHIEIFNKKDKPIYADWSKSALVIKDQSYALWNDDAVIKGNALEFKVNPNNTVRSISSFEGTISKQDKVTFIPPQTKITRDSYQVCSLVIDNKGKAFQRMTLVSDAKEFAEYDVKKYIYTTEDTPLAFKIFLTLSDNENFNNPIQLNSTFWASDLINSGTNIIKSKVISGNQFFNVR